MAKADDLVLRDVIDLVSTTAEASLCTVATGNEIMSTHINQKKDRG